MLGDEACWIWEMADLYYPDAQLDLLKVSKWRDVITNAEALTGGKMELKEAKSNLEP